MVLKVLTTWSPPPGDGQLRQREITLQTQKFSNHEKLSSFTIYVKQFEIFASYIFKTVSIMYVNLKSLLVCLKSDCK